MQDLLQGTPTVRINERPLNLAPSFARLPPPTIIIGMHRSGTSMVAGMLHLLGGFVDPELVSEIPANAKPSDISRTNGYGEAVAFRLVNEAIMAKSGSTWNRVDEFMARRDQPKFAANSVRMLTTATHTILQKDFLEHCIGGTPQVWGWKDPRNSLTLPYWLKLFPQARLLHVRRDPAGIIDSLQRREAAAAARAVSAPRPSALDRIKTVAQHPGLVVTGLGRRLGIQAYNHTTPHTYEDWLALTQTYTRECEKFSGHPGGYLEVSYEAILKDPIVNANIIADYTQSKATLASVLKAASFVLVDRNKK